MPPAKGNVAIQALFYQEIAPISNSRHADYTVNSGAGYDFARQTNFVPLAGTEFEAAAWHYPIVFVDQGSEGLVPAAILGFGDQDNLFVGTDGAWNCAYVPAYVRRYPYILANVTEQETFTVCVDEAYVGCQQDGDGERLFLIGGGNSPYLEGILSFVQQYHGEFTASAELCKRLTELDLFEPMQAQVALNSGEKMALGGFNIIGRERLHALSAEVLQEFNQKGILELLHLHLFSLANFGPLMDRHSVRLNGSQP
ncbi:MAG: SapC family protein [Chromatiales bacterium]|jgi:hypothetical protein|nr:SapC family protein [Chromatiales bacterium]